MANTDFHFEDFSSGSECEADSFAKDEESATVSDCETSSTSDGSANQSVLDDDEVDVDLQRGKRFIYFTAIIVIFALLLRPFVGIITGFATPRTYGRGYA